METPSSTDWLGRKTRLMMLCWGSFGKQARLWVATRPVDPHYPSGGYLAVSPTPAPGIGPTDSLAPMQDEAGTRVFTVARSWEEPGDNPTPSADGW